MKSTSKPNQKLVLLLVTLLLSASGCVSGIVSQRSDITNNTIPAHRLPDDFAAVSKKNQLPIDLTLLRKEASSSEHVVAAGDVLGIYVEAVLAVENELPTVFYPNDETRTEIRSPSVGLPVNVNLDGTINLPLIGEINVAGLTIPQVHQRVEQTYKQNSIITDRQYVSVQLIRPHTVTVYVVREDTGPTNPTLATREQQVVAKRGSGHVLELPPIGTMCSMHFP